MALLCFRNQSPIIMKTHFVLMLTALLLSAQATSHAQTFVVKQQRVSVVGTSSLHDWESVVEKIECKGSYVIDNNQLTGINHTVLKIAVKSIRSSKGKLMDSKTWDAFSYEKHPYIVFSLKDARVSGANLILSGILSMAGANRPVEIRASYTLNTQGDLQVKGSHKITMSEFGMTPPTAMMGSIKVGDDVVVNFDITLTHATSLSSR